MHSADMNKENYVLTDTLKDAFQKQYATLADCLEGVMPTFAKKLYEKKLISRPVMRSENYDSIVTEFLQGLQFLTSNESVNEHCHLFIKVLCEMEGATMNGAAQNLSKAWTEAAKKCGFDFKLPIEKIIQQKEDTTQQICKCGLPAVLLIVKKKNKNKGRQFWKCPRGKGRQCKFFEWADECNKGSLVASSSTSSKYSSHQCLCGLTAAERTSKQEGPNRGRLFYNCPKDKDEQCKYFEWGPEKYKGRKRSHGKRYRK